MKNIIILIPFLIQLFYSLSNYSHYGATFLFYCSFFFCLLFFLFGFLKINILLIVEDRNHSYIIDYFKVIVVILFFLKLLSMREVFLSGIDYASIRGVYYGQDDKMSLFYYNSKVILYLYNYIYSSFLLFFVIKSIVDKQRAWFWIVLFIGDGVITGGRFSLYYIFIIMFLIEKNFILKSVFFVLILSFISMLIQFYRGDDVFSITDGLKSILQYHIVPVAIMESAIKSGEITNSTPFSILFSGLGVFAKILGIDNGFTNKWQYLQDYLDAARVYMLNGDGPFNAFGNVFLFAYFDMGWLGSFFLAFIYLFMLRLKSKDSSISLLVWILVCVYFSSFQSIMISPSKLLFIILFCFIYKVRLQLLFDR